MVFAANAVGCDAENADKSEESRGGFRGGGKDGLIEDHSIPCGDPWFRKSD